MTYKPNSVDKMADFETLTLCISLNSSQMSTYFGKDLVTGILSIPYTEFDSPTAIRFQVGLITHTLFLWV